MGNIKTISIITSVSLAIGFAAGLYFASPKSSRPSPDVISIVTPSHEVKMQATVKASDKTQLRKQGAISKESEKDKNKEVTSAAKIQNESGTTYIANELNTVTGISMITSERPAAEWMSSNAFYFGVTGGSIGLAEKAGYTKTFTRVWKFYGDVNLEGWHWIQRSTPGHKYDGQIGAFLRLEF